MKKLLDLRIILAVILVISWVVVGLFFWKYKEKNEATIAEKDLQITDLQQQIADIGELVPAYCVVSDVVSGKQIEESDLQYIEVPLSMSTNLVQDSSELVGKYFKIGMTSGTVITVDDVYEEVITDDMRYLDLMVDVLPIGLQVGEFVDIRMKVGTGADYVGIAHCQVKEINGNCLKVLATENDIMTFSSMLVDMLVYSNSISVPAIVDINQDGFVNDADIVVISPMGAYLYAIRYVEGGNQVSTQANYTPSLVVQSILTNNPNLINGDLKPEDELLKRKLFITAVTAGYLKEDEVDIDNLDFNVYASTISSYVKSAIADGQAAYEVRVELEKQEAMNGSY